jgi:hypothetical protein
VSAALAVNEVQAAETITMVVSVSSTAVVVESQLRRVSGEEQLEGRIELLPPTMAAGARSPTSPSASAFTSAAARPLPRCSHRRS